MNRTNLIILWLFFLIIDVKLYQFIELNLIMEFILTIIVIGLAIAGMSIGIVFNTSLLFIPKELTPEIWIDLPKSFIK